MNDKVILPNEARGVLEQLSTAPGHFAVPRTQRELHVQRAVLTMLKGYGFVRNAQGGDTWEITQQGERWLADNKAV
jgi:ribosomal protein S19E (S16A)